MPNIQHRPDPPVTAERRMSQKSLQIAGLPVKLLEYGTQ
jgi:hypothetical protein